MVTALEIKENRRLEIQRQLDSSKTQVERNKLGQFATPTSLAVDILTYAKSLLSSDLKLRFLDPAFGTGSFFSALLRVFPIEQIVEAIGYEIDEECASKAQELWQENILRLHIADFTTCKPPARDDKKANLLICNPPYVRHHHLSSAVKQRLRYTVAQLTGIKLSGQSGLYCYFLCLADKWMAENGLAGWLIPSEFMDVNYGKQVKQFLLNQVTLLRIHRFEPKDLQFNDALVSSAVVWFRKAAPPLNHEVEFSYGGTLLAPRYSKYVSSNTLRRTAKWTGLTLISDSRENTVEAGVSAGKLLGNSRNLKLADLFDIKRGLATGANNFFLLTENQIVKHQIPLKFLVPVLPGPRYLLSDEIKADDKGNPILDRKIFLLTCDLSEGEIKSHYPSLWRYLQMGVEMGVDKRYLCSHRSPWYSQEKRPPSLLLCTYMGRQNTEDCRPFRFILNLSRATVTNVYLILYPKPSLQKLLIEQPEIARAIWQHLNNISSKILMDGGRVYGDGLHKLEPNELANIPLGDTTGLLAQMLDKVVPPYSDSLWYGDF